MTTLLPTALRHYLTWAMALVFVVCGVGQEVMSQRSGVTLPAVVTNACAPTEDSRPYDCLTGRPLRFVDGRWAYGPANTPASDSISAPCRTGPGRGSCP